MQVVIIAFIALAVIYQAQSAPTDEFLSKLKAAKENCKTSDQAKDEETFGNAWGLRSLPDSESGKCFIACLFKEFGAFVDGKFNVDVFIRVLSQNRWSEAGDMAKAKEIHKTCVKRVQLEGKGECAAAHEILRCFFDESEKVSPSSLSVAVLWSSAFDVKTLSSGRSSSTMTMMSSHRKRSPTVQQQPVMTDSPNRWG